MAEKGDWELSHINYKVLSYIIYRVHLISSLRYYLISSIIDLFTIMFLISDLSYL